MDDPNKISLNYDATNEMSIPIAEAKCFRCGNINRYPVELNDLDPIYIMALRETNVMVLDAVHELGEHLVRHGRECVEAGFEPSIIREIDEVWTKFEEVKRLFGLTRGDE